MNEQTTDLAGDILTGAEAIAEFLYEDRGKARRVYHMAEQKKMPSFKLGHFICARKSTLLRWIEDQEAAAA